MFTTQVTFTDAVFDSATIIPSKGEGALPGTRAALHATFTSSVAAALGLQHLKDLSGDAKCVPLKTECKAFRAVGEIDGIPYQLHIDGHAVKQMQVKFPEDGQPWIHFCVYSVDRIAEWSELSKSFGMSPFKLTITPLQPDLDSEDGAEVGEDRVFPQREEDGSYPFNLATVREFTNAHASAKLYALEVNFDCWIWGWEYRFGDVSGRVKLGCDESGQIADMDEICCELMSEAFQLAAKSLADTLEGCALLGTKKEQAIIDSICEWLQPIIEGTAEEPDLADAVAEAVEG